MPDPSVQERPAQAEQIPAHRLGELGRAQRVWTALVAALAILGSAALVIYLRRNGWTQVGDEANQIYDSQRAFIDWPLLGDLNTSNFYGNVGSHHPGPLPYYLLAPFVLLLGPQMGAWIFAVAWNCWWLSLTGWFAYRTGGARIGGAALLLGIVATQSALDGRFASVFFQELPLTPLLFSLVGAWVLTRGDTLVLPFLAFAASYVIQAATVNLPLVIAVCLAAVAAAALRARRDGLSTGSRRHVLCTALILLVAWLPPLWDQAAGSGNFGLLLRADIPHAGLDGLTGLRSPIEEVLAKQLGFAILALLVVAFTARRRPVLRTDPAAVLIVSAAFVGIVVNAMLIPYDDIETTHWNWVPMAGAMLVLGAVACVEIDPTGSTARRRVLVPLSAVVIALAAPFTGVPNTWPQHGQMMDAVTQLDEAADRLGSDRPDGLAWNGPHTGLQVAQGLLPRLQDGDQPVGRKFGGFSDEPRRRLLVVTNNEPTRSQRGSIVDVHRSPHDGSFTDIPDRIESYIRDKQGLILRPTSVAHLANLLDGIAPSFCLPQILDDPDQLIDMGPEVLTRLYGLGFVSSPLLPDELEQDARNWLDAQPVALLIVEPQARRLDDRLWSGDSC